MAHTKKKYQNGQPRFSKELNAPAQRNPKDYYRVMVGFHGGDLALEAYVKEGRKGYR